MDSRILQNQFNYHKGVVVSFKILNCGCHAVDTSGNFYSALSQFSRKGRQGIVTVKTDKWKLLNPITTKSGYLQISLHKKTVRLNRLIAITFIPNPKLLPESQHINGNRKDNRVVNLKWGNPKENALDREGHGNTMRGTKSPHAKLSPGAVRDIRKLRKQGKTLRALADQYNVSKKLILLVVQNKIWRDVYDIQSARRCSF
jgi:hypothetical protein